MAEITTIVGPQSLVRGRVEGDEDMLVEGRVEGEIALSRTLYVETSGIVQAEVRVDQAVIGGTVIGDVYAKTAIQVTATGRVVGSVHSPRIVVGEGACLQAELDTEDGAIASPNRTVASASRASTGWRPPAPSPSPAPATVASSVVGQALAPRPAASPSPASVEPLAAAPVVEEETPAPAPEKKKSRRK